MKEKYNAFKSLLTHDKHAHERMAELEEIYYQRRKTDFSAVLKLFESLSKEVAGIVEDISRICPLCHPDLLYFYKKIDAYIRHVAIPEEAVATPPYALKLEETDAKDQKLVGGKALNLAIVRNRVGLPVPDGFTVTTHAYHRFIEKNGLRESIDDRLAVIDIENTESLNTISAQIQKLIMAAEMPRKIEDVINEFYELMMQQDRGDSSVAMRSSAVEEDSQASFAGQYRTVLNVRREDLGETYKEIIAGKYSPEAIYYRINYGLSDDETPMAVLVLKMMNAVTSGVMYTADIEAPQSDNLTLHAVWGLGEMLVSGQTAADMVTVSKNPELRIIKKRTATQSHQMVYGKTGRTTATSLDERKSHMFSLTDPWALTLSKWGLLLENYFQKPQDIEWAIDASGNGCILQTRPLAMGAAFREELSCDFEDISHEILLQGGECAASGIAAGTVFNMKEKPALESVPQQAVLVAGNALPQYARVINRLSAVITDAGSSAGHLASVAREFQIPALMNTGEASAVLEHGQEVTVHADGRTVYAGSVEQLLASPCARVDLIADSSFMRKLRYIIEFVSPLNLVDPEADSFIPQRCRSFHDIIRFAHERAVQEMFFISRNRLRKLSFAKKLTSEIPMQFYVLDVGGGLQERAGAGKEIRIEDVQNRAMLALWKGLSHPDIHWGEFSHFDWAAHDKIVMSGGIASPESTMFASHAVISHDYLNLNLRFGYHFVIVDVLLGSGTSENNILFRFSGGGADIDQRMLRAEFLRRILQRLGFDTTVKSDLIDARFEGTDLDASLQALEMLGRLLGATRLMDMYLKDDSMIEGFVDDFMRGRYDFASTD